MHPVLQIPYPGDGRWTGRILQKKFKESQQEAPGTNALAEKGIKN
jgi:hypothetical protein